MVIIDKIRPWEDAPTEEDGISIPEFQYISQQRYIDYLEKKIKHREKKRPTPAIKVDPTLPTRYRNYLRRALKRKLPFELSLEYFEELCTGVCEYCGGDAYGVDRVHPDKGYTMENSVPCCKTCNMMKYTYSQEKFLNQIKNIHDYLNLGKLTTIPPLELEL